MRRLPGNPWWGHFLIASLYLSHASYKDSPWNLVKFVVSFLNLAIFAGGKNLLKNLLDKSAQFPIDSYGSELNHAKALSLNEKGNSYKRIASSVTPFLLMVLQYYRNLAKWSSGVSFEYPPNWWASTICMSPGLISKLFAWTAGLLVGNPDTVGTV